MLTLKLDDIISEGNVRVETGDVSTLAKSIDKHGVIQPPRVVKTDDESGTYTLLAGHRRVAAVRELGWESIAVIEDEGIDGAVERIGIQYAENVERKDLTDWEQAQVAWDLKLEGLNQGEIASAMGLKKKDVSELHKVVKVLTQDEGLDESVAQRFDLHGLSQVAEQAPAGHAGDVMALVADGQNFWNAVRTVDTEVKTVIFYEENQEQLNEWSEAGIEISHTNPRHHWDKQTEWGQEKDNPNVVTLETLEFKVAKHIGEPCHMVYIDEGYGTPKFVHYCMNRRLHTDKGKSDLKAVDQEVAGARGSDPKAAAERKAAKGAKDLRRKQAEVWMRKLPSKQLLSDLAIPLALNGRGWSNEDLRAATWMLGLNENRPKGADYGWYERALKDWLTDKFEDHESEKAQAWKIKMMHARKYIDEMWPNEYITDTLSAIEVPDAE